MSFPVSLLTWLKMVDAANSVYVKHESTHAISMQWSISSFTSTSRRLPQTTRCSLWCFGRSEFWVDASICGRITFYWMHMAFASCCCCCWCCFHVHNSTNNTKNTWQTDAPPHKVHKYTACLYSICKQLPTHIVCKYKVVYIWLLVGALAETRNAFMSCVVDVMLPQYVCVAVCTNIIMPCARNGGKHGINILNN